MHLPRGGNLPRTALHFHFLVLTESGLSDHFAVTCNLLLNKPKSFQKSISSRNLHSMDRQAFRKGLHKALAVNDLQDDVQFKCKNYDESLKALLDRLALKKIRTVVLKPSFPWMTDAVRDARYDDRRKDVGELPRPNRTVHFLSG